MIRCTSRNYACTDYCEELAVTVSMLRHVKHMRWERVKNLFPHKRRQWCVAPVSIVRSGAWMLLTSDHFSAAISQRIRAECPVSMLWSEHNSDLHRIMETSECVAYLIIGNRQHQGISYQHITNTLIQWTSAKPGLLITFSRTLVLLCNHLQTYLNTKFEAVKN